MLAIHDHAEIGKSLDRFPVHLDNDITWFKTRFLGTHALRRSIDAYTSGNGYTELLGDLLIEIADKNPQHGASHNTQIHPCVED